MTILIYFICDALDLLMRKIKNSNQSYKHGFTLIEVLIASIILAMIGYLLSTVLFSSAKINKETFVFSQRYHEIRQAMSRIRKDLSMAYLSKQTNQASASIFKTYFKGGENEISFVAFGNILYVRDIRQSDQRRIEYYFAKDNESDQYSLYRRVQNHPSLSDIKEQKGEVIATKIEKISFEYWDEEYGRWLKSWSTEGISGKENLPNRLKISIDFIMRNNKKETFETQVEILLTKPIEAG